VWPGARLWRDIQRFDRDLDWPVRVPAARETFQAEPGPADRDTFTTDER
jgi:hypothetical protein